MGVLYIAVSCTPYHFSIVFSRHSRGGSVEDSNTIDHAQVIFFVLEISRRRTSLENVLLDLDSSIMHGVNMMLAILPEVSMHELWTHRRLHGDEKR